MTSVGYILPHILNQTEEVKPFLCSFGFMFKALLQITFKNMSGLMFFYWQWCSKFRRVWWPNKLTILFHPILLIILLFFFPVSQSCLMANTSRDVMWVFSASINLWLVRLPGSCTAVSPIAALQGVRLYSGPWRRSCIFWLGLYYSVNSSLLRLEKFCCLSDVVFWQVIDLPAV